MTAGAHWPGRVRAAYADDFGEDATLEEGFGPIAVDVPPERWVEALRLARDVLDCGFFDFLTAVDEWQPDPVDPPAGGFRVVAHVADHVGRGPGRGLDHLLVRTLLPRERPVLESAAEVYAGARWHERETREMFGVEFTHGGETLALEPLLLPEEFEGHPLRKEFVLASRVAKPWPGAKEPGESEHESSPSRRRTRPPGVPTPDEWGPRPPGSPAPAADDPAPGKGTR